MFTRKFDRRVHTFGAVTVIALVLGLSFGTYALWPANVERGYQPEQPVYFPHSIMAGKHEMDCLYCHQQAEKGAHAGIPPVSLCIKCHGEGLIQPKDARGEVKESIRNLLDHWEQKKPIPWEKVHDLADFVYFDHSRHLTEKAGLECADCHGEVENMDRVVRVHSLKMGWCLECHMEPAPEGYPEWQTTRGPIHCSACHR